MKKEAKEKGRDADFDEWCDLYALVGCAHLRYKATTEDVQKGFKVAQIKYHPDKTMKDAMGSEEDREAAEELFARVQRAYETLTNVKARREFDSIDHFDESVGSNDVDEADFYETFAELFESNGRFSEKKPVPKLGDANTDMKVVDAFYKFWFGMKSWREFKADDEHTINDGDDREHKRHLQRQNAKMREKAKKEERERVIKLVQNAFDCDPRIQARKRAAQEAKDKVKNEKERIRREKEEAEAAAKKAEEDAKAAEEAARKNKAADAKKEKEKRRKEQQKNRKALRAFTGEVAAFDVEGTESLCTGLDFDKLKALVKDLEAAEAAAREELLCTALKELDLEAATRMEERAKRAKELESKAETAKAAELAIASERLKNWTEVELKALKKGLAQFPAGARNRWESIANVVGTRDAEEVTALVKTCPGLLAGKPEDAYSKFLSDRKAPKGEAVNAVGSKGSSNAPAWTPAATSALVKAMGAFPASKYDGTERWERVAAAVPGEHTPAQCQRKAVELAKAVAAKKKAAAEAGPA
eukprot:PRCOL_00001735-RA